MSATPTAALSTRLAPHLQRLAVEIGARPGGSPANRAAAEYIRSVYQACGMDVEMQMIPFPAWREIASLLEVNGASIAVAANPFSPSCDVTAAAVAVATIAQLEAADLTGRICIIYGDLAANTLAAKAWFLKSEKDERIIQLLEQKAPAAIIAVQPRLGELERIIEDAEFLIPSATVPARAGLALLSADTPTVHLRIDTQQQPGQTWNVIGRRRGASQNRIILCAHYDTKFGTPGALDNGSGVAVVLALAELLQQTPLNLGLECIAFANEDSGLPCGSLEYVQRASARLDEVVAVLNFDEVGHALDVNTVCMMANSQPLHDLVDAVKQSFTRILWTEPWPESDHSSFAMQGVAALAFTCHAGRYLAHLRDDTIEWASIASLDEVSRFAAQIVQALQESDPQWARSSAGL